MSAVSEANQRPGRSYLSAAEYLRSVQAVVADERIAYDDGQSQWIDVYKPQGRGPFPAVVLIHGGCWNHRISAECLSPNAAQLARAGAAVFNVEYRRIGEPQGGYPGMYLDLSRAMEALGANADAFDIDPKRIVVVGHSAGAHLALWVGSRARIPTYSPLFVADALRVRSVVAIAGPGDLRRQTGHLGLTCAGMATGDQVTGLPSTQRPDPFIDVSPRELLPTGTRTVSITGVYDDNWPPYVSAAWCRAALAAGDQAPQKLLPDSGHFEVIDTRCKAWLTVRDVILSETSR
jgi:acetyl esterase/lipase